MKAVMCEQLGSPEALVVREVESPTPGAGEVKVALKACGVSYVDVLLIAGQYQVKRAPLIPGSEASVSRSVGPESNPYSPVTGVTPGGFAEKQWSPPVTSRHCRNL